MGSRFSLKTFSSVSSQPASAHPFSLSCRRDLSLRLSRRRKSELFRNLSRRSHWVAFRRCRHHLSQCLCHPPLRHPVSLLSPHLLVQGVTRQIACAVMISSIICAQRQIFRLRRSGCSISKSVIRKDAHDQSEAGSTVSLTSCHESSGTACSA